MNFEPLKHINTTQKSVKVITGIVHANSGLYIPYFWIDHQGFSLNSTDELTSAEFQIKMLVVAFKKLMDKATHVTFIFNKSTKHYWGKDSELII